jgi:hypothetical protein
MKLGLRVFCVLVLGGISGSLWMRADLRAQDRIMGRIQFVNTSKEAKSPGVWVDGQYVGNLGELKGSNRLRLMPGDHEVTVRQAGFADLTQKVTIEPGAVTDVPVKMNRDAKYVYPDQKTGSEVRLDIVPTRAAVFVDDAYLGTVDDYYGVNHAMLLSPGKHRFKVTLPGFRTFETEVDLMPRQKFELRTALVKGSINDADPSVRYELPGATTTASEAQSPATR